jgi:HAMP domain-containing protein
MVLWRGWNLRVRLLLVVLLAILPMVGLALIMAAEQRRLKTVDVQAHALHLVRVLAHRHEQLIAGTRQLLTSLAHAPEVSGNDPVACSAFFATVLRGQPLYTNLGVLRPDGTAFCRALPGTTADSAAGRAYFQRVLATRDFAMGDFQIGLFTGKPIVVFASPVLDATQALQAVVFAALDLTWLTEFVTTVQVPTGVTLTVVDQHGTVLARAPDPEHWLGRSASDVPIIKTMLAQGDEGTTIAHGLDGIPRVFAFTRLRGTSVGVDAYVGLGVPTAVVFAEANRLLTYQLVGLSLVLVVGGGVTWGMGHRLLLRPVQALAHATQRLASGDLGARTGVPYGRGELGHLARAFDAMAATLAMRQATATQAEAALARQAERLRILHEIDRALLAEETPEAIAGAVIQPLRALLGVPRAIVCLFDWAAQEAEWLVAAGRHRIHRGPGGRYSMRLAGDLEALRRGEAQVIKTQELPPSPEVEALLASGVEVYMVVPMLAGGELIGALSFGGPPGPFPAEQVSIAQEAATQLAIVMAQARLRERVQRPGGADAIVQYRCRVFGGRHSDRDRGRHHYGLEPGGRTTLWLHGGGSDGPAQYPARPRRPVGRAADHFGAATLRGTHRALRDHPGAQRWDAVRRLAHHVSGYDPRGRRPGGLRHCAGYYRAEAAPRAVAARPEDGRHWATDRGPGA